jgi:ribosomal protein L13
VRAVQKDRARGDDACRKVIAGTLALEYAEKTPQSEFGKIMARMLDECVRSDERRLFKFLPVYDGSPTPNADEAAKAARLGHVHMCIQPLSDDHCQTLICHRTLFL